MRTMLVAALTLLAAPALAAESDDFFTAREIGQVISSAETCGYSLDNERIKALIRDKVAGMAPDARAMVQAGGSLQKRRLAGMSTAEKAAACAVLEEAARQYSILK